MGFKEIPAWRRLGFVVFIFVLAMTGLDVVLRLLYRLLSLFFPSFGFLIILFAAVAASDALRV